MSDTFTKIISTVPESTVIWDIRDKLDEALKGKLDVEYELNEEIVFEDCGGNLEEITCPRCGEAIDFEWWGEAMSGYFESGCENPNVKTPCCGDTVSLNDLNYNMSCGLARAAMVVNDGSIDDEVLAEIENIVGEKLRVIRGRI